MYLTSSNWKAISGARKHIGSSGLRYVGVVAFKEAAILFDNIIRSKERMWIASVWSVYKYKFLCINSDKQFRLAGAFAKLSRSIFFLEET